jgi:hypothetical protein
MPPVLLAYTVCSTLPLVRAPPERFLLPYDVEDGVRYYI